MLPEIPPDVPLWVYLVCVGGAVLILGIAKAGFGGGVGILAVPLMAVALPPAQTIGVMLPVLVVADLFSVAHHRGNDSRPHLTWLITGAIAGIVGGTLVLILLRQTEAFNTWLNLIIGSLCLVFVTIQCYRLAGGHVPHVSALPYAGRIAGFTAGFVSTIIHAAGPVITIYLLEQRLAKHLLVGTAVMFAFAGNLLKLPTYFGLQLINPVTLVQSLWCLPLVPVGTMTGIWMHKRINEKAFTIIMYVGAAAAAAHMLYKAFV
ncbi:MAG: sulfite exporter TauE/SafE family protein [Phycisphaeraceae bacterium]